jgi:hypothetical protein
MRGSSRPRTTFASSEALAHARRPLHLSPGSLLFLVVVVAALQFSPPAMLPPSPVSHDPVVPIGEVMGVGQVFAIAAVCQRDRRRRRRSIPATLRSAADRRSPPTRRWRP